MILILLTKSSLCSSQACRHDSSWFYCKSILRGWGTSGGIFMAKRLDISSGCPDHLTVIYATTVNWRRVVNLHSLMFIYRVPSCTDFRWGLERIERQSIIWLPGIWMWMRMPLHLCMDSHWERGRETESEGEKEKERKTKQVIRSVPESSVRKTKTEQTDCVVTARQGDWKIEVSR